MKTIELTGAALDWAVAKCEGAHPQISYPDKRLFGAIGDTFDYSTDWAQGGPIIDRETLCLEYDKDWVYDPATADPDDEPDNGDRWMAWPSKDQMRTVYGPTPLIAAMRCYVASKLGDEVDVPEKLI